MAKDKFQPIVYRQHNGYDTEKASNEAVIVPWDEDGVIRPEFVSLTVQSHTEDADINIMVKRFGITGQMPQSVRLPQYGDYVGVTDFRGALEAVMQAESDFMKLPAEVRLKFNNDPGDFFDFAVNPDNIDALRSMGLAVAKPEANVNVSGTDSVASTAGGTAPSGAGSGGKGAGSGG